MDDIRDKLDDLRVKLDALHAIAGERMGKDKWDKICEEGTARRFLLPPNEDRITRRLVENGDPFLIAAIARRGDQLQQVLSQFDSDEAAVEFLIKHRDMVVDLLDADDIDQTEYEGRRTRMAAGQDSEQSRYERMRAGQGAFWARGRK